VTLYSQQLIDEGVVTSEEVEALNARFPLASRQRVRRSDSYKPNKADWLDGRWSHIGFAEDEARRGETGVELES
jgi:2-oxoglutarate dehydrogenase E1 component